MIDVIETLSAKEAISEILGAAKAWYLSEVEGYLVRKRGLFFDKMETHSHKWQENGREFDFCVKCGVPKEIEKYYSHGCPVSAKQYDKFPYPQHNYETIEISGNHRPIWMVGSGYINQPPKLYRFEVCRKCGLIRDRETIFYKLDKDSGKAYEVSSPVGAKKKHIHCSYTDDEYDVRDIII